MLRKKAAARMESELFGRKDVTKLLANGTVANPEAPSKQVMDTSVAIELYTNHRHDVVQNPSSFQKDMSSKVEIDWNDPKTGKKTVAGPVLDRTHKKMYFAANRTMETLARVDAKNSPTPEDLKDIHWRGVGLPARAVKELAALDYGSRIRGAGGKLVSLTLDRSEASKFAGDSAISSALSTGDTPVMFKVTGGLKRGTHIAKQSRFGSEGETVTSGEFRMVKELGPIKSSKGEIRVFEIEQI